DGERRDRQGDDRRRLHRGILEADLHEDHAAPGPDGPYGRDDRLDGPQGQPPAPSRAQRRPRALSRELVAARRAPRAVSQEHPVGEGGDVEAEIPKFERTVALFKKYGDRYDIDYLVLMAQGYQESELNQNARSAAGAIGIMQVMPATGRDMQVGD